MSNYLKNSERAPLVRYNSGVRCGQVVSATRVSEFHTSSLVPRSEVTIVSFFTVTAPMSLVLSVLTFSPLENVNLKIFVIADTEIMARKEIL